MHHVCRLVEETPAGWVLSPHFFISKIDVDVDVDW